MRWSVAIVVGYVLFGLELVVRRELAIGGGGGVSPGFLLPFVVFVGLYAPVRTSLWVGLVIGLLVDVVSVRGEGDVVIGPYALGFAAAAFMTVTVRASVFSHRRATMVVLSVGGALLAELIVVTLLSVRSMWGQMSYWQPMAELWSGVGDSLYTGLTGAVLAIVLVPVVGLFDFTNPHQGRIFSRPL